MRNPLGTYNARSMRKCWSGMPWYPVYAPTEG